MFAIIRRASNAVRCQPLHLSLRNRSALIRESRSLASMKLPGRHQDTLYSVFSWLPVELPSDVYRPCLNTSRPRELRYPTYAMLYLTSKTSDYPWNAIDTSGTAAAVAAGVSQTYVLPIGYPTQLINITLTLDTVSSPVDGRPRAANDVTSISSCQADLTATLHLWPTK